MSAPQQTPVSASLSLPAQNAFASVLRSTAASLAARMPMTIDDIEDLRIAVSEGSSLLLALTSGPEARLDCHFELCERAVSVTLSATSTGGQEVDTSDFAWQVLTTLAEGAVVALGNDCTCISFRINSTLAS